VLEQLRKELVNTMYMLGVGSPGELGCRCVTAGPGPANRDQTGSGDHVPHQTALASFEEVNTYPPAAPHNVFRQAAIEVIFGQVWDQAGDDPTAASVGVADRGGHGRAPRSA
jgi:hypothetical protein